MEKRIPIALAGLLNNVREVAEQDEKFSELIALASKLSAGEQASQTKNALENQSPQQMISIFDRISMNEEPRQNNFHYLPLAPLALDKSIIFAKVAEFKKPQTATYESLLEELGNTIIQTKDDDVTYLENLLVAMQRTTWCIPAAYSHSQLDVSLYDHNRMTSALAMCLAEKTAEEIGKLLGAVTRNYQNTPKENGDDALLKKPVALLVGGDISGVQDFIYTISSKQAAKTLRGRSFYLQLLTEAVLRYVLRELDLPVTNVIYSGGGHFYLLAPLSAKENLDKIQSEISKKLLKHHGIGLYLAVGQAEVSAWGFQKGNFPDYWKQMHADLNRAKRQRYTELKGDMHSKVFALNEHGGNQDATCSICGRESKDTEPIKTGSDDRHCGLCKSFAENIGKDLPKSQFVGLGFATPKETERKSAFDALRSFGMLVKWPEKNKIQFDESVERAVVWSLDDAENWPSVKGTSTAYVTRYTVNLIPMNSSGYPKTFDELQGKAHGMKRLGVLRMDVDDLGNIFSKGLGKEATLARLSALSFQMSLFFEGWLKRICEQAEYKNLIYAVYAGGDDLFVIGPWDKIPGLAQEISDSFAEYTNYHPDFHISGGMAFIGGKYPVYQAADDAEGILDMAKDLSGKNAFGFLEQPWKWDDFIQISYGFELICSIVDELDGPKAIMQLLRELTVEKANCQRKDGRLKYGPWMWQGTYRIYRMERRAKRKHQDELAGKLKEIRSSLEKENFENLDQWGTAARWAQLYLRQATE